MTATTLPDFNPSNNADVADLKSRIEVLIRLVSNIDGDDRCREYALYHLEAASMWAVKSLFVK